MTELKLHPACDVWPAMPESELAELAADIKTRGLLDPITMFDGQILDGRNRALACERANIEPRTVPYEGDDPIGFVVAKNKHRRHLSCVERAMIAAEIANLRLGHNQYVKVGPFRRGPSVTQAQAAKLMEVSETTLQAARAVQLHAADHIATMVKTGEVGLQSAAIAARGASKADQATWKTPADIKRVAKAKKQGAVKPAQTQRRQPSLGEQLEARAKRLQFRQLSDEEAGRPPPEIAHEEDPDFPGMDRAYGHVLKHGRVQLWSPAETERLKLRGKFLEFNAHIIALATRDWPEATELDRLGPDAARVRGIWAKHLRAAQARLSACLIMLDEPCDLYN
jgi:ParB-like chromosome segregation protein Spo0J